MSRRALVHSLLLALVVPLLVLVAEAPASACSCVAASLDEHRRRADAVFSGEVLRRSGGRDGTGSVTYTVRVDRVFKGEVASEQEVLSGAQSSACGIDLQAAQRAVFFAHGDASRSAPSGLRTDSCSGTRAGDPGHDLGQGRPPTSATAAPTAPELTTAERRVPQEDGVPVLGLLAGVPLLGLGVLALRRRRAATRTPARPGGRGPI